MLLFYELNLLLLVCCVEYVSSDKYVLYLYCTGTECECMYVTKNLQDDIWFLVRGGFVRQEEEEAGDEATPRAKVMILGRCRWFAQLS